MTRVLRAAWGAGKKRVTSRKRAGRPRRRDPRASTSKTANSPPAAPRSPPRAPRPRPRTCVPHRPATHTLAAAAGPRHLPDHRPRPPGLRPCPDLLDQHSGWDLHQLRHSAATQLGDQGTPLQLIMAKTRHRNPRTAMRYVKPSGEAVAEVTELLDTAPRRRG